MDPLPHFCPSPSCARQGGGRALLTKTSTHTPQSPLPTNLGGQELHPQQQQRAEGILSTPSQGLFPPRDSSSSGSMF